MSAELGSVPVFLRVGGGGEFAVGSFDPHVTLDGTVASVVWRPGLAGLLRAVAGEIESGAVTVSGLSQHAAIEDAGSA